GTAEFLDRGGAGIRDAERVCGGAGDSGVVSAQRLAVGGGGSSAGPADRGGLGGGVCSGNLPVIVLWTAGDLPLFTGGRGAARVHLVRHARGPMGPCALRTAELL